MLFENFSWVDFIKAFSVIEAAFILAILLYNAEKTKKERKNNKNNIILIISLTTLALFFATVVGFGQGEINYNNPNYYCPQNPEDTKCIIVNESCPETICVVNPSNALECYEECRVDTIKNYHFKTDCEKNPKESQDCYCNEWSVSFNFTKPFDFPVYFIDENTGKIKEVHEAECISARDRTPAERCAYFNRTPVYDLNNTDIIGCE